MKVFVNKNANLPTKGKSFEVDGMICVIGHDNAILELAEQNKQSRFFFATNSDSTNVDAEELKRLVKIADTDASALLLLSHWIPYDIENEDSSWTIITEEEAKNHSFEVLFASLNNILEFREKFNEGLGLLERKNDATDIEKILDELKKLELLFKNVESNTWFTDVFESAIKLRTMVAQKAGFFSSIVGDGELGIIVKAISFKFTHTLFNGLEQIEKQNKLAFAPLKSAVLGEKNEQQKLQ